METREINSFLNYPEKGLVDYAVSCANLTDPELQTIYHRVIMGQSIEVAAESLNTSPQTIKRRSNTAYDKLNQCWSGKKWIETLIKQ